MTQYGSNNSALIESTALKTAIKMVREADIRL